MIPLSLMLWCKNIHFHGIPEIIFVIKQTADVKVINNQCHNWAHCINYIFGLAQDCNNSSANALELLQTCAKPSNYI